MLTQIGLSKYGWSDALRQTFQPYADQGLVPARVIVQQRGLTSSWPRTPARSKACISSLFRHEAAPDGGYPVTGDWVACELKADVAVIAAILPRSTAFTRMAAGTAKEMQVVAANVDVALLAASLNADLNPRRLERYLAAAYESSP